MPRFIESGWGLALDVGSIDYDEEDNPIWPEGWEMKPISEAALYQLLADINEILDADSTD